MTSGDPITLAMLGTELKAAQGALAASQADLTRVERENEHLRGDFTRVRRERDLVRAELASARQELESLRTQHAAGLCPDKEN